MTIQSLQQICIFIIIFSISCAVALIMFFYAKDKVINKVGSDELKEANNQVNKAIDDTAHKVKDFVDEKKDKLGLK
jgi:hypothetical protein